MTGCLQQQQQQQQKPQRWPTLVTAPHRTTMPAPRALTSRRLTPSLVLLRMR
jgi:hypothetical protein